MKRLVLILAALALFSVPATADTRSEWERAKDGFSTEMTAGLQMPEVDVQPSNPWNGRKGGARIRKNRVEWYYPLDTNAEFNAFRLYILQQNDIVGKKLDHSEVSPHADVSLNVVATIGMSAAEVGAIEGYPAHRRVVNVNGVRTEFWHYRYGKMLVIRDGKLISTVR